MLIQLVQLLYSMLIFWQMYTSLCCWITQEQVLIHCSGFGYKPGSSLDWVDRWWVQYTHSTLKLSDGNTYAAVMANNTGFYDVIAPNISYLLVQRTETLTQNVTDLTALPVRRTPTKPTSFHLNCCKLWEVWHALCSGKATVNKLSYWSNSVSGARLALKVLPGWKGNQVSR